MHRPTDAFRLVPCAVLTTRALVLCAVLIAVPATARASDAPEPLRLSLDAAVELARRNSPLVKEAEAEVARARGARLGVEPLFPQNPTLAFDAGPRDQADEAGTKFSYQMRLEQPVELFGQRARRLEAADQQITLSQARLALIGAEVAVRLRRAYVEALIAARGREFAAQRVAYAERVLEGARLRVAAGASSEVEARLPEAESGRARAAELVAQGELEQARSALRAILDLAASQALMLTTPLAPPPPPAQDADALVAQALARRRDLLALRQEGRAIDAELARLRAERIPPLSLAVNVQQDSPDQYWVGPGIAIAPPVWRRNQGAIAQAEAERQRNRVAVDASQKATERDLRLAVLTTELRRREFELLDGSVLRTIERSRDLILDGWTAGKLDIFRVLAIELDLVAAQQAFLGAISALWQAQLEIDRALGVGQELP